MNFIGQIILMAFLLVCSAFCSGSETAFFNLSPRTRRSFRDSANKLQQTASMLLSRPEKLLTSLLFGNMAFNVLYFAIASSLSITIRNNHGTTSAVAAAVGAFFAILLFGEMLPKSIAFYNSRAACILTTPFCLVITRLLSALITFLKRFVITPIIRLLTGSSIPTKITGNLSINQFRLLIDSSKQQGLISGDENQLFGEVMELRLLKVRHVMQPRVDMICAEIATPRKKMKRLMLDNKLTTIPVYAKTIDNVIGFVDLRDLIIYPDMKIASLINKARFVPEQKTVESLLEYFRQTGTDTAVVVDEYGGIAGLISLEDCVEQFLGPIDDTDHPDPITQLGPLEYRLNGNLPIHDWAETFGIDIAYGRTSTIAGLTAALLGTVPKKGDTVRIKNLKLTVENVRRHRITSLKLTFENISEDIQER